MKPILTIPVAALGLILTGCEVPTPSVLSLEPVATDTEAAPDISLAGVWESSKAEQTCVIHKEKDKAYDIVFLSGDSRLAFEGRIFRAGDAQILDLMPEGNDDFRVPGHAFARVWVEGGALRWAFLDSDWLKEQLKTLPNYVADDKTLLLAPGPTVRALIEKIGADEKAYSTQVTWQRMQ